MEVHCYTITDLTTIEALKSGLTHAFKGVTETGEHNSFEVYDSFDWRLHCKGWQLTGQNGHFAIVDRATGRIMREINVDTNKPRKFLWDFPVSEFSECLEPVLEMRALLPMASVEKRTIRFNLCNIDDKIVARLAVESYGVEDQAHVVTQCRLVPVRGYQTPFRKVIALIEELKLPPAHGSPIVAILEQSGASPGVYSSKVNISLKPETPAGEAVRFILENLFSTMRINLPGVRQDIDTEFLHDFRVSVRRARSLLSQIKGVLDTETATHLQRQLKSMGVITGNVRDLDVYLLKEAAYINHVPEFLKPGIIQLFRTLQRKRRYTRDRMVKAMAGAEFDTALSDLNTFVKSDPLAESDVPGGVRPIGHVAKAVIYKRYRRIIKKGRQISDTTPDARLHELRIDCKKLRYLLEFFTSLFPKAQMKMLIKQLKQLQENLGDFNDLSVQQDFLMHHLGRIRPQTAQVVMLSAAVGGLITRLSIEHQRVRSQFLTVFRAFDAAENKQRFKTLFAE